MFSKNVTITDCKNIANFKLAIPIGSRLGVCLCLMLNDTKGTKVDKRKIILYISANYFRNLSL